jgi:hypothetical protein
VVAEATGRSEEDVMADLLDDGVVNFSNRKEEKNLVEQLKEAAELITTVQAINKEVASNSVLNGGKNKTEVAVETTLEGDIVDRAIESIQRKSERIKKLLVTLTPLLLIITGGSLDALGIIELTGDESNDDDHYDTSWDMVWGCTAWDADNYDAMATEDDGSCYWDNGPDEIWGCMNSNADNFNPNANRDDGSCYYEPDPCENLQVIQTQDPSFRLIGESNNAEVIFYLKHNKGPECDGTVLVDVMISLYLDNGYQDTLEFGVEGPFSITGNPQHEFGVRHGMLNGLGDGEWSVETRWKLGNGPENCCVMSSTIEIGEPEPETECDAELINPNAELTSDEEGILMSVDIYIGEEFNCDDYTFELYFRIYENGQLHEEGYFQEPGTIAEPDRGDYRYVEFNDLPPNEYSMSIHLYLPDSPWHNDNLVSEVWFDETLEVPEEEEPCDAQVNNHYRGHENNDPNSTTMVVAFLVTPDESCGTIDWTIELYQNGYEANYTRTGSVSGGTEGVSQTFEDMTAGTWIPRITLTHEGVQVEQVQFWALDIVEQEPEPCEINLWGITFASNSTHAQVAYDLDCGQEDNNLPGYNVTVQFLVYEVNGTNSGSNATGPITWLESTHYIQGWIEDVRYLTLANFTESNATYYDFYWYATWTDADGEVKYIERTWLNRELNT